MSGGPAPALQPSSERVKKARPRRPGGRWWRGTVTEGPEKKGPRALWGNLKLSTAGQSLLWMGATCCGPGTREWRQERTEIRGRGAREIPETPARRERPPGPKKLKERGEA
ncbi:hypothetical protein NDU88_006549 [Pleurodeles waltl]|uniref:Uncharacterized protein n=1 Tax=Pleurodeles waltl TaxID=8319 RepID=A0AAV7QI85_PLEWA|nr:hypothetical protein NDU88_006549 [Pleurodeles waltl]